MEVQVLGVFTENHSMTFTNSEIAVELGLKDNSITGRTNRLRGLGKNNPYKDKPYLVVFEKRKCRDSGHTAQALALHPDTYRMF